MTRIISQPVQERIGGTGLGPSYSMGMDTGKINAINVAFSFPTTNDIKAEITYNDGVEKKYYTEDTAATVIAKT